MTQNQRILDELRSGRELTTLGIANMGIASATKRMSELIRAGHPIGQDWRKAQNGSRHRVWFWADQLELV